MYFHTYVYTHICTYIQYVQKGTYFYLLLQLYEKKDRPDKWALVRAMAVDPHSFFADPDPAVFMNADPGPGPA